MDPIARFGPEALEDGYPRGTIEDRSASEPVSACLLDRERRPRHESPAHHTVLDLSKGVPSEAFGGIAQASDCVADLLLRRWSCRPAMRGQHVLLGQIEKLASSCLTSVHLVESDGHQHEGAYRDL